MDYIFYIDSRAGSLKRFAIRDKRPACRSQRSSGQTDCCKEIGTNLNSKSSNGEALIAFPAPPSTF